MPATATLKAVLKMDSNQYKAGMQKAKGSTKSFQQGLVQIGQAMAAAFSIRAITAATKAIIDFASDIRHTADNLDLGTESLQALNATALKYGLTVQDQIKLLGKLRQSQGKVSEGDVEYTDSLDVLKISQDNFADAKTDEALVLIARAYVNATDKNLAYTASLDLLGRAGKQATAFLKELAREGLDGITKSARESGSVISDEMITKLELFGTKMEQLGLQMKVWGANAASAFLDASEGIGAMVFAATHGENIIDAFFKPVRRITPKTDTPTVSGRSKASKAELDEIKNRVSPGEQAEKDIGITGIQFEGLLAKAADKRKLALRKAGRKRLEIEDDFDQRIEREKERDISVQGQGIGGDSLAQTGGIVGGTRAGLGIADRQLKIAQANLNKQENIEKLNQQRNEMIADLVAAIPGNGE